MLSKISKKIFGSSNERSIKKINLTVENINSYEKLVQDLNDEDLKNKTNYFRDLLENKQKSLDEILPEAFAVVKEAAFRAFNQKAYNVQLIGGVVLHQGNVAEMRTGEGKSLTAIFPSYLNAIQGLGVHVITVNDYLAKRDADKMRILFDKLDLTVGCNISGLSKEEKDHAYSCDITYGTANEFGFDYLRDNMALSLEGKTQRGLNFALIDEVDSVLIDEARTPLIISDSNQESVDIYMSVSDIPNLLTEGKEVKNILEHKEEGDYYIDLKTNNVFFTEEGYRKVESELVKKNLLNENESLYDIKNTMLLSIIIATIKAHTLFFINKHYIVSEDKKIKIIDEHTGRIMEGRRWNDGLHQAIEAKENVEINPESITLATITLQNYFKLYSKLAGMTGTADTEAFEFNETYNLNTIVIPTNKPIQRIDKDDKIFLSFNGKATAVLKEVKEVHKKGQPILLGTNSIEKNEMIYEMLRVEGLPVNILNAKNHHREAEIIAQAGKKGAITVATNMAGRGTDIILGGNIENDIFSIENSDVFSSETKKSKIEELKEQWIKDHAEVVSLGGLHVIGTERNESRRIDNQLRGRAGRQGDPGSSIFFTSFEDDLLKPYAERIKRPFQLLNVSEYDVLEGKMLNKQVSGAQEKVEKMHYEMRKNLMDFDATISLQREAIYDFRNSILEKDIYIKENRDYFIQYFSEIVKNSITRKLNHYIPKNSIFEMWDINGLLLDINETYNILLPITPVSEQEKYNEEDLYEVNRKPDIQENKQAFDDLIYSDIFEPEKIHQSIIFYLEEILKIKFIAVDEDHSLQFRKVGLLQIIDRVWREHLTELDYLKKGIHLRGYAQKDPKQEFKQEAFKMFKEILPMIEEDFTELVMRLEIQAYSDMKEENKLLNSQISELNK